MSAVIEPRLKNFPVAWFSAVMGLAGFSIAWSRAEHVFSLNLHFSPVLLSLTALLFVVLLVGHTIKLVRFPKDALAEFQHPVKLAFVPTFSIALILLSIASLHAFPALSAALWYVGSTLHLLLTLYVLSSWIHHDRYEIAHLNPAWFIPVVGNILIPVAGVHHAPPDVSWFFFSLGLFFWPVLTAILFYRLIFHGSLPERFMPTLFIFIAPPAVGFISWVTLIGGVDAFARVLYFVAMFFTLLWVSQIRQFIGLKFFLSWWAYSFPLAAVTIASLLMFRETGLIFHAFLATVLLAALSFIIALLLGRTAVAVLRREICLAGH